MILEEEPPTTCQDCGKVRECRPYTEDGHYICFQCMTSDPAKEAIATKVFNERYLSKVEYGLVR